MVVENLEILLLICKKIRVSDYPLGFGYPRISILGMKSHPNRSSDRVRVLVLGTQALHSNRTRPVAIPTQVRPNLVAKSPLYLFQLFYFHA